MLVLTRHVGQRLILTVPPSDVEQTIVVMLVDEYGGKAKIGVECPRHILIEREEIHEQRKGETK